MPEQRFDRIGRRIPEYDRKAAGAKGKKTRDEKYGPNHMAAIAVSGGRRRGRGYLGYLRDTDPEKLKELAQKAGKARGQQIHEAAELRRNATHSDKSEG